MSSTRRTDTPARYIRSAPLRPSSRAADSVAIETLQPVCYIKCSNGVATQEPRVGRGGQFVQRVQRAQVELIFVQTALQSKRKPIVALTQRIDRLLIDQQGIDYPAHLDELLPISTVGGKARYFAGRHRSDLPETDLGHHPLEPSASNGPGRRARAARST